MNRKEFILAFLILINFVTVAQSKYEMEARKFYSDILNDSYTYSYKNFLDDSVNMAITRSFVFDFEYKYQRDKIDTVPSAFMLRTDNGRVHFDTLYLASKLRQSIVINKKALADFLKDDSIFEQPNPFKDQSGKCIRNCNRYKNKITYVGNDKTVLISEPEIEKIFKYGKGWDEYYSKYGGCLVEMTAPIFSLDYELAYFEWSYSCGGLCAYSYFGLYRKQNGKWVPIKVEMGWMS